MSTLYCARAGSQVSAELVQLIEQELWPQLGLDAVRFWVGLGTLLDRHVAVNKAWLERRGVLQLDIDGWQRARRVQRFDVAAGEAHLVRCGYRVPEGPDCR